MALGLWPSDAGTYVRMSTWLLGLGGIPMDWGPPLYSFSVAVAMLVFGAADYVATGVSAFFGVVSVILTFFLGRQIFDERTGLVASLLVAVTEYHIVFSRVAIVDIATTVFYTLSFITFYAAFTKRKTLYYVMFGICFGLSMLTKYLAFLCFAAPLLFIAFVYLVRFRDRKLKMKDVLFDLKGMFIAAVIAAVMYMPWVFAMGIGSYMSSGHASQFSLSSVDPGWVLENSATIFKYGIDEQIYVFTHNYSDGIEVTNDPAFYFMVLPIWVSPLILLFFLYSLGGIGGDGWKSLFLLIWILTILIFVTFFVTLKGARLLLPAVVPICVLASRGILSIKDRRLLLGAIALIALTSIALSANTIASVHDGYRNAGNYIDENVGSGDLIFYTGMPQILFYHETNTGNWWRAGDKDTVKDIDYVILQYHKSQNKYLDVERFERDFDPIATFYNDDPWEEVLHLSQKIPDYERIDIYKVDRDISGYFKL